MRETWIWRRGHQTWYLDGKHHREDGPAQITPEGEFIWCLAGEFLTAAQHRTLIDFFRS